ncbi:uncharacterized protein LOC122987485 isoform X2 [Thunnus albacares]|uniref:uncharacterized protein LOC122987485 isoform X2 n=1 Tax=Thunnus albacares TaxID=8236 RepID=UPI001CF6C9F6|nr:uncharacterized protein LOC122987485 isoform X2 [Thunnus albacares]
MKLFMCCLILLPFATTAQIRARRENVLSFLNDALGTTTEKTISANITAYRNPPSKPVKEQDSEEDMSEAKSTEIFDTDGVTEPGVSDTNLEGESRDAFKDLDSYEITIPKAVEKDKAPSRRKMGVDKDNMGQMDMSSKLVWDYGSRGYSGPQGALVEVHRASREHIDLISEEGVMVSSQEAGNLQRKQVSHFSGDQVTDSASQGIDLQRKASSGRAAGLNGMLAPGRSRELLDQDSLEDNNGRPAAVGNSRDIDYDETKEFISSETYPLAPPQHMPSSFSAPANIQAS